MSFLEKGSVREIFLSWLYGGTRLATDPQSVSLAGRFESAEPESGRRSDGTPDQAQPTWLRFLKTAGLFGLLIGIFLFTSGANSDYIDSGGGLLPRLVLFISLLGLTLFATNVMPSTGVIVVLVYLVFFGFTRRLLIPILGFRDNDPLTLVTPIVAAVFMGRLILTRRFVMPTLLTKLIGILLVFMLFGIINPLGQAGIVGNLAGALFYMIPLFWFFYGFSISTPGMVMKLLNATMFLAVIVAAYGVFQTFFGFLAFDYVWMDLTNYTQILGKNAMRVFSTFNGFSEYVYFIAAATILSWARFVSGKRPFIFLFVPFFLTLFLSSSRGIMLTTLSACVVVVAIQAKSPQAWIPRLVVAAALAASGLIYGLRQVQQAPVTASVGKYINHQTEILDSSFTQKKSGAAHLSLMASSVAYGVTHPVGRGLAAGTIAEGRFSDDSNVGGAEYDLGNILLAVGATGGITYLIFGCLSMYWALRLWHIYRHELFLMIVGLLVIQTFQWLTGAHYSIVFLVWFCLGFIARAQFNLTRSTAPVTAAGSRRRAASPRTSETESTETKPVSTSPSVEVKDSASPA